MGLDLNALFGKAEAAATQGMNDLLKQGGNAGLGYLEKSAIDVLSADKAQHDTAYQNAVTAQLQSPATPGSFAAYLQGLTQDPVLKQYGGTLIIAVIAIGAIGFLVGK